MAPTPRPTDENIEAMLEEASMRHAAAIDRRDEAEGQAREGGTP
jgi:hypothetical protein